MVAGTQRRDIKGVLSSDGPEAPEIKLFLKKEI